MSEFHFLRPFWLLALPVTMTLAWWALRGGRSRAGPWRDLIDPALMPALLAPAETRGTRTALLLLVTGWLLGVVALAGPSWERLPEPVHRRDDALVIALDLSLSMNATDVAPSRLERARFKLRDLLAARKDGFTALIAWAGDAHVVTPLSDDTGTVTALLDALSPSIMPEPGSNPVAAARRAIELLHGAGLSRGRMLLVCDALSADQAQEIDALLEPRDIELSVLAVGTAAGAPVPLPQGGFARERDGSIVVPGMDADAIRAAAVDIGARFAELSLDDRDLRELLPEGTDRGIASAGNESRRFDQWLDRAPWLACLLLPLAALAFRRGWLLLLPLALLVAPPRAVAFEWQDLWLTPDQQGARALAQGDAARAARVFATPAWRGTAAHEAGDYDAAADAFAEAQGADAQYNRGNALARAGRLEDALAAYDAALEAQPGMDDAQHNRDIVEKLLQGQESQQQEQGDGGGNDRENGQQQSEKDAGQEQSPGQQGQQAQQTPGQDAANGDGDKPKDDDGDKNADSSRQPPDRQPDDPSGEAGPQSRDDAKADGKEQPASAEPTQSGADEAGDRERAQALEQWLRQVPDEPGELLRRKFEYESRARRAQEDR